MRITATFENGNDAEPIGENMTAYTVTLHRDIDGATLTVPFFTGGAFGEPTAADVLECLLSDAALLANAPTFADFCDALGYDTDSRRAERDYEAVKVQTASLRLFLGAEYVDAAYDAMSGHLATDEDGAVTL